MVQVADGPLVIYPDGADDFSTDRATELTCTADEARELAQALLRNADIADHSTTPADAAATADEREDPGDLLWTEFLSVLTMYGDYQVLEKGVEFRQETEQSSRIFVITPSILQDELAKSCGFTRQTIRHHHLPQGFLDDLHEFIGALQEPYDHRFVVLVDAHFHSSPDGASYRTGGFINHALGPVPDAPTGEWFAYDPRRGHE